MNRYIFVYLQHISNSVELCICITMTYEKNKWDISLNSSETLLSLFMFSYKQRPIMIIYFHNFYKQVFSLQIYSNVTSFSHPGYQNLEVKSQKLKASLKQNPPQIPYCQKFLWTWQARHKTADEITC